MAKKTTKVIDGDVITITFVDSDEELQVDINDIPAETISKLAMHGLSQKLGDSTAGTEPGEAFGRASAVAKDLLDGNWSTRVAAAGPRTTQLAEALAAATGKSLEEAAGKIEAMDDDGKKDLRAHPHIKAELAKIKAAKATVDAAKAAASIGDTPPLSI